MTSSADAAFDLVIAGALLFDGDGDEGRLADVGVRAGKVAAITDSGGLGAAVAEARLEGAGLWLPPGFIDLHTHYDAEVEAAPALLESLRHGVTTVMLGSCSISAAVGEPEDIADIFCRVEGIPRSLLLPLLQARKDWQTFPGYLDHLATLPLGPNVAAYVGHSNLRMAAMGFARSLQAGVGPTAAESATMTGWLEEALDAGYVGLSAQTLPWDKLDGSRERSKPLPATFASWRERRALAQILRRRGRVFQGVPDLVTKFNVLLFLWESVGLWRPRLRTTVISWMDLVGDRTVDPLIRTLLFVFRRLLGAEFRFQALPNPFEVRADGMDLVIFEEFAAGAEALHLADLGQRADLLRDEGFRQRFLQQWQALFSPRVYHRDLRRTEILSCPDTALVGRSFAEVAAARSTSPALAFLDLCAEHGASLRWHSVVANDRPDVLAALVAHPGVLIGFSDAGAHLRNMAFYDFPLRLLRLCMRQRQAGKPALGVGRAIQRVTSEIADFYRIDAGRVRVGCRADLVLLDPQALSEGESQIEEVAMPAFGGLRRMVNREPGVVQAVVVGGRLALRHDQPDAALGRERGFGVVLRAA